MNKDQVGKASETEIGDLIFIQYRKPHEKESPQIENGFHAWDEVIGFAESGDVLTGSHGSIHPHTIVKKTGTITDLLES